MVSSEKKYLMIDCQRHLGFNNILFVLQMGISVARLLHRTLAFSSHIRMRRCDHNALCQKSVCQRHEGEYHCPFTQFFDPANLAEAGVELIQDEAVLLNTLPAYHDLTAFDEFYNPGTIVIDQIPRDAAGHILPRFSYYQVHFSCECSPTKIFESVWNGPSIHPKTNTSRKLIEITKRYEHVHDPVLYLHGTPHRIGRTPTFFSSEATLLSSVHWWVHGTTYHRDVEAHARQLVGLILGKSQRKSFTCVHLRRDDFTDLGWNKKALNLEHVIERTKSFMRAGEALYIATDEDKLETLDLLRQFGALFWVDFQDTMIAQATPSVAMLGFKDYVGLIEQKACAVARSFLGTHCSSFSGTIVSMRRQLVGDGVLEVIADEIF